MLFILCQLVIEAAPLSKDRKSIVLEVPLSTESIKQYRKALMFLYEFQYEQWSIKWPSPKNIKELLNLIKEYERNLVYDQVQTNIDRATHCDLRLLQIWSTD